MGIFSRLTDIINSNINSILDKAEDPAKMIRLVIQEMEETLVEVRSTSARIIADKKELERRNSKLTKQSDDWQNKAELALSKNRDDLAKAALLEKASVNEISTLLLEDREKLDFSLNKLTDEIEQLQAKLNDARARQKTIVMRHKATESRKVVNDKLHNNTIDNAINKFEHYERRIENMESEIESYDLGKKSMAAEFNALEKENEINAELAALKAKLENKNGQ